MLLLDSDNPASPCRYSGKGQDGSAPPFQGSLPSNLSLREGSEQEQQAGANAPEASPMKMRYPILIFSGLCWSAWVFL